MKYEIRRASSIFENESPCEEAFCNDNDLSRYRTFFININTLEELYSLIKKYGDIVIGEDKITIYDDYLE